MLIGDLFERSVTRPIPPVVYFHEQGADELQREVDEYIITGGYGKNDSRANAEGIHEQFVHLLRNMHEEMRKPGGPELPACWISGFYGSGKSSFAKLFGLALDGRTVAKGKLLAEALLAQDRSPEAPQFRIAWDAFVQGMDPLSVVFDIGAKARDTEQIHAVAVRQVQARLGYSSTSNLVADYELKLELEGLFPKFLGEVQKLHRKPWAQLKDSQLAEDYFSAALHALDPKVFDTPMAWVNGRIGSAFEGKRAADEAVVAIEQMIATRAKGKTLFLVIDEVSQYVHEDDGRMLALQSFVMALGQRMRGRAWILATGQQKLEEGAGVSGTIVKLKGRFPPALRVHLGSSNIREVVYRRLLRKKKLVESELLELFHAHRPDLALYGYQAEAVDETAFVEIYPLLPGHIDLLLRITTGLRARGTRVQGDAHEIRGLLQLLGDMFREQDLGARELGWLVTIDRVYDILHTALDADLHLTLNRALDFCQQKESVLMKKVVKAVAMLELVQDEKHPTTVELIARSLYAQLGQGNQLTEVQAALDALAGEGFVAHAVTTGYKIESSAGQEWQRERDMYVPGGEQISAEVQSTLYDLLADIDKVSVKGLPLSWLVLFSDNLGAKDVHVIDDRKPTNLCVDFQLTKAEKREDWIPRSATPSYENRIVWVVGEQDQLRHVASKLVRANRMVERYGSRPSMDPDKQRLLIEERNNADAAKRELADAVKGAFMAGSLYSRGRDRAPRDEGSSFVNALTSYGARVANEIYVTPVAYTVGEKEILYLIESADLSAPPSVFGQDKLGLLSMDAGRYEVTCSGRVPQEMLAFINEHGGVNGSTLIATFGGPPHGVPSDVVRAVVVGLLRAGKLRIEIPGVGEITSVRDEGVRELVKDSGLRKAKLTLNTVETLSPRNRVDICNLFKEHLGKDVPRDNDAIADAVAERFPVARERLTQIDERFRKLPSGTKYPEALNKLGRALETCRRDRHVEPTVLAVKRHLPALRDGLTRLTRMESDFTDAVAEAIVDAANVRTYEWKMLAEVGPTGDAAEAIAKIGAHLDVESPWEDASQLAPLVAVVRAEYRARRKQILDAHAASADLAIDRMKRREGFDHLNADQRHLVLQYLTEGAVPGTDDRAIVPVLQALEGQLAAAREAAEAKALRKLDELREAMGGAAVVEVSLDLEGREVETEAEVDRMLADLRARILSAMASKHRVRLMGS